MDWNKKNGFAGLLKAGVAISFALSLVACGDDNGSNSDSPEKVVFVSSIDDLEDCSDDQDGDTVFVKAEKSDYICIKGKWTNADSLDSQVREDDEKSSSSMDKSNSSSSVIQSGKEESSSSADKTMSSSSSNEEMSSSVTLISSSTKDEREESSDSKDTVHVEGASSSSFAYEQNSSAYVQPDIVAIEDKSISGVSQKGPFVTGSTIKLYELDGKTCASTGKSFPGKIASDDGKFSVSSVTLVSQYALLEANGYFRNEVSGRTSRSTMTLNALTDLSDRKTVNINLLTHLEYERVLYLVGTGINLPAAKKQAETEILNAFGIRGDFASSEDLDIFGKGEANAALLAFSILMLGDLNEAELTRRLSKFAIDIEKDGAWDDEVVKANIADWARSADLNGNLRYIRDNIKEWNLGVVPDFEKYVRKFWYMIYGLGNCDSKNGGEVTSTKNEYSNIYNTQFRFICKDDAWVEASNIEKDFYMSNKDNGDDGELWVGPVTGYIYKYDEGLKKWLSVTQNDKTLKLNGCATNRIGEVGKSPVDDTYYMCSENGSYQYSDWRKATEFEYDTYGETCTVTDVGKRINGMVFATNNYYCSADGWVRITADWSWNVPKEARLNPEITYGTLTDSRDGKKYKTVKIGDQTWMAENLNYSDSVRTPFLSGHSWCYDNESEKCDVTGRLYTWWAAVDSISFNDSGYSINCDLSDCYYDNGSHKDCFVQCSLPSKYRGICPSGWHLPNNDEWNTLIAAVGDTSSAGVILKSQTGWKNNGSDDVGFSALPGGRYTSSFGAQSVGNGCSFWSFAVNFNWGYGNRFPYAFSLSVPNVIFDGWNAGFSVRCLKD